MNRIVLTLILSAGLCFAAGAANIAPTITNFSTNDNPALVNTPATFSLRATDPDSATLFYTINFGDAVTSNGNFAQGSTITAQHTYTQTGNFTVRATVSDGTTPVTAQIAEAVPAPGNPGVPNIDDAKPVLVNPLNGVSMGVNKSNGGVVQLAVSVASLTGDVYDPVTTFNDIAGNATTVAGNLPVHKFTQHGIFVAVTKGVSRTNGTVGGIQCKMITVSAFETGENFPNVRDDSSEGHALPQPPNNLITTNRMTGKFDFSGTKQDQVTFSGQIVLPAGLDTSKAHEVFAGIGNNISQTQVSTRGSGDVPGTPGILKQLTIHFRTKKNSITKGGEKANVQIVFKTAGLVGTGFETEGVSNKSADLANGKAPRKIQVALVLDGVSYVQLAPVVFQESNDAQFGTIHGRH